MHPGVTGAKLAERFADVDPELGLAAAAWASARALGLSRRGADRVAGMISHDIGGAATLASRLGAVEVGDPGVLAVLHESRCTPPDRKARGVHYTPIGLAHRLAHATLSGGPSTRSVCDPTCGGGSFLVAAAAALVELGGDPRTIVARQLFGADLDPLAVAVTHAELALWATREIGEPAFVPQGHVVVADSSTGNDRTWSDAPANGFDVVIGNPPFGGQLRRRTARSAAQGRTQARALGLHAAGYVDEAALFLLAASQLVARDGQVMLVLPRSLMSSRDAAHVRAVIDERCTLEWMWVGQGNEFSAGVQVWAPCFTRRADSEPHRSVPRLLGSALDSAGSVRLRRSAQTWGYLVSDLFDGVALGDDELDMLDGPRLDTLASLTAGFRTQFYGLAPHTASAPPGVPSRGYALVTSGAIDPLHVRWGHTVTRFAGRDLIRPVVDLDAVRADDPALAGWVDARLLPKVLVAPQSGIIEALLDSTGTWVPSTPVISVEPHDRSSDTAALLAAALTSPVAAAWARHHAAGTGLSSRTVRLSARLLAGLSLPVKRASWQRGADLVRAAQHASDHGNEAAWSLAIEELGPVMTEAYGLPADHRVVSWWNGVRPGWRRGRV